MFISALTHVPVLSNSYGMELTFWLIVSTFRELSPPCKQKDNSLFHDINNEFFVQKGGITHIHSSAQPDNLSSENLQERYYTWKGSSSKKREVELTITKL